jgi:toxin-antitoxin system PIN domain toxin
MTSLSFLDVNVWLALLLEHHVHRASALEWWGKTGCIAVFTRMTQLSVLRLLTTPAPMDGQPLTMAEAWKAYDNLFADDRVALYPEPSGFEARFRQLSQAPAASPKVWADAYLVAFASGHRGQLVTFDRALENRGADCLVLR